MKKLLLLLILTLAAPAIQPMLFAAPSAIEEPAQRSVEIRVATGGIELLNHTDSSVMFQIYSITGQLIKSMNITNGGVFVELPQGCYIIKHSFGAQKVVVH